MTDIAPAAVHDLPLEPGGSVEINLSASDVRVRGIDGDRVVVRSRGGEPLGSRVSIDIAGGIVRIRDGEGIVKLGPLLFQTRHSPSLDIDLPRRAAVSLRTLSGDVEATGIGGPNRWATASGDLRIAASAGPVSLETMSGDAVVEASAAVTVAARTVSGDLRIRAPRLDALDASSTSGSIHVEADLAAAARHSVSSVSGDVDIATASPVRLEAQTITGDVRASGPHAADGGRGRRTLVVGNGSVGLSVRTTSGDVRLRVLGGRPPSEPVPGPVPAVPATPAPAVPTAPVPTAPVPPVAPVPPDAPAAAVPPVPPDAPASIVPIDAPVAAAAIPPEAPVAAAAIPPEAPAPGSIPGPTAIPGTAAIPGPTAIPGTGAIPGTAPRPVTDEDTQAWSAAESMVDRREAARLDVLRALERGDLDVETASRRLEALEEAGPRYFRGWC